MATALKKWMQKEDIYDNDIYAILQEFKVTDPEDSLKPITPKQWDEIYRRATVERFKELKDQNARSRIEAKLKKIEKQWRKVSGNKSTSIKKGQGKKKDDEKEQKSGGGAPALKKHMKKEGYWNQELFDALVDRGVTDKESYSKIGSNKALDDMFKELRVKRAKDLKDNDAKLRFDALLKKFEKEWRAVSGVKLTSVTGKTKKKKDDEKEEKKAEAPELKKFMKKSGYWNQELYDLLVEKGVTDENSFGVIASNKELDELKRDLRVKRAKDLKDNDAKLRNDALLTKFEKDWRAATGIKVTSVTSNTATGEQTKAPKDEENEILQGKGKDLKNWMRKENVWQKTLFEELLKNGIEDPDQLAALSEVKFEEIVRIVRVERFKELKDAESRARCDQLLITFEKNWRAASGIKKTSIPT